MGEEQLGNEKRNGEREWEIHKDNCFSIKSKKYNCSSNINNINNYDDDNNIQFLLYRKCTTDVRSLGVIFMGDNSSEAFYFFHKVGNLFDL